MAFAVTVVSLKLTMLAAAEKLSLTVVKLSLERSMRKPVSSLALSAQLKSTWATVTAVTIRELGASGTVVAAGVVISTTLDASESPTALTAKTRYYCDGKCHLFLSRNCH